MENRVVSTINQLILELIDSDRRATSDEAEAMIAHVAQAPFASYLSRVPGRIRRPLAQLGILIPRKMPNVEWHLLERVHLDQQWPVGTTTSQYLADLHQAVQHPYAQMWTYYYYEKPHVAFLAPSHIEHVPKPEAYIFVCYSPIFDSITTGYQASSPLAAFGPSCERLIQHK